MMQVVGMLDFSSCNYRWNSIKLRKTIRVVTSCPTPWFYNALVLTTILLTPQAIIF